MACVAGEIVFARVRVLVILADLAARSDLPILRTALQFLCQKLCSCYTTLVLPPGTQATDAFFYEAADHICAQNLLLFKTSFVQYGMRVPLDPMRYIKDCLVLTCNLF